MPAGIRDTEVSRTQITGGGGGKGSISQPDISSFVMWQAYSSDPTHHLAVLDVMTIGSTLQNRIYYGNRQFAFPGRKITCKGTLRYDQNANSAGCDYLVGFANALGNGVVDPRTIDCCVVGIDKPVNAPPGNWTLFTSMAGAVTSVDSGVAIVTGQRYKFTIVMSQGTCGLFINNVHVANSSTNLPVANCGLVWWLHNKPGGASTQDNPIPASAITGTSHQVFITDNVASGVVGYFEYNYLESATP